MQIDIVQKTQDSNLTEPKWLPQRQRRIQLISPVLLDWLLEPGSMTMRLRQACRQSFKVNQCFQSWQRPRYSEAKILGQSERQLAVIREVELLCDGEIWVSARSVFP